MMRLTLLLFCTACALHAVDAQALAPILTFVLNTLQKQLQMARLALGVEPIVSEPPPDLAQLCRQAKLQSCKRHGLSTADGYLLELHHVPASAGNAVPVLVMHGNFATSDAYLLRADDSNLASVLHEAGYDVWLGNWRGSTHSMRHVRLSSTDPAFYNYSIHELGVYDLPAMIDYILKSTGQPSLHVIGHSMACPAILAGLATRPEYNAKIRFAALMAPVVFIRNFVEVLDNILFDTFYEEFTVLVNATNTWSLGPRTALWHYHIDTFCRDNSPLIRFCRKILEVVFGVTHPTQRYKEFFPVMSATHPGGSSFAAMKHYSAISISGRFRPLGKGPRDPHPPPAYNLSAVTAPVGLYYGATDATMSVKDMEPLGRALGNLVESYLIPLEQFSHLDFMTATDVRSLLYDRMIRTMKTVELRTSHE